MSLSVFLDREEMFIFSLRMTENLIRSVTQCHDPHDMINSIQICNFRFLRRQIHRQEKEYYCVGKICDGSRERVKVIWSKFRQMLWVGGTE